MIHQIAVILFKTENSIGERLCLVLYYLHCPDLRNSVQGSNELMSLVLVEVYDLQADEKVFQLEVWNHQNSFHEKI